ncbi:MAG: histidine kinase [Desulfobacteraceae bacterium]|nr:MAG: histidine kinase [Desulfobacteraceae bacterium]
MKNLINLRLKIYLILSALVFITLMGGISMVWYTFRMENVLKLLIEKDVAAFQAAESLETALVNQKGFVTYYFLDNDPDWLRQLGEYRQIFREKLGEAKLLSSDEPQKKIITDIEYEYDGYIKLKDSVINHYKNGNREEGVKLHREVRNRFFRILDLCNEYKNIHMNRMILAEEESHNEAVNLRFFYISALLVVTFLVILMLFILVNSILKPIYRLSIEAGRDENAGETGDSGDKKDEITVLAQSVRGLLNDIDQTHHELEKSRDHLQQAEKMALVGKLAAGMAHSIRNPFTSVKMRLFSLSRSQNLTETQKDDIKVISDEIRHIDTIVQNFLEFSRPPRLKMQKISPSVVVDLAIQLLEHRLKSYDVTINLVRKEPLPEIDADPEQLKEVLVNLMVNACEAMVRGGIIEIHENEEHAAPTGRAVVLRLSDNGPGIPEPVMGKVMEPFFTTKEEGTGLGLSIVARIVEEHGGRIDIKSKEGEGTEFIITLPLKNRGESD